MEREESKQWDITFSPHKSISVAYAFAEDAGTANLIKRAQMEAADMAFRFAVMKEFITIKTKENGNRESEYAGLGILRYLNGRHHFHTFNRHEIPEPQIHTHTVFKREVTTLTGKHFHSTVFRLKGKNLLRLDQAYQRALYKQLSFYGFEVVLSKSVGSESYPHPVCFFDMSIKLVKLFSRQGAKVQEFIKNNPKAAHLATKIVRNKKPKEVTMDGLKASWAQLANEHGLLQEAQRIAQIDNELAFSR